MYGHVGYYLSLSQKEIVYNFYKPYFSSLNLIQSSTIITLEPLICKGRNYCGGANAGGGSLGGVGGEINRRQSNTTFLLSCQRFLCIILLIEMDDNHMIC